MFSFRYIVKVSIHVVFMIRDRDRFSFEVSFQFCVQYCFSLGLRVKGLGLH